jgi:23S rRNA C2498 (ribose-2'-O)-methylase RlmM
METSFEQLESRIKMLITKLEDANLAVRDFRFENEQLKNQLFVQNEELKNFKNRDKITRIVEGVASSNENSARLKQKINEYIKEIDKCIAYLSEHS